VAAGLVSAPALAQMPEPPPADAMGVPVQTAPAVGPIRGFFRHVGYTLHDKFIGYPEQFIEPPLGFYLSETLALQKSRVTQHQFMLYRSDFMEGDTTLSPVGAQRLSLLAARMNCWAGPITVEWTPDRPGLADARRTALLAMLQKANLPVVPERIVIGPSPYPGTLGADANNNFQNMIFRDQQAAITYSLTPTSTANFGSGAR
jgi:hypothetical protein